MPASTASDALARLGVDEEGPSKAGHYTLIFGLMGVAGEAATGVLDYYETKNRPVRRQALYHGLTNTALVGSYVLSFLRREDHEADDAALVGLFGYLGGALVYEHGVRVGEDRDGIPGAS